MNLLDKIHYEKPATTRDLIEKGRNSLFTFAKIINPSYLYGDIHEEVFSFLQQKDDRQLILLPRGHLKSHCIAVQCVHEITYLPWSTIVYVTSQEDLAKAQLFAIKQMMTSDIYLALFPEMLSEDSGIKGERGAWSAFNFDVDHPVRKERGVRDHTMQIKTVKSNAQGLHGSGLVFDDVVVPQFAYTTLGREELARSLGYFSSILNPGGWIKAVGTRYHPQDAYQQMIDATVSVWKEEVQDFEGEKPLWTVLEKVVEDSYDRSGTGRYLWPRTISPSTGESYGFDVYELAKIKADYKSHFGLDNFYAQYYNDPNTIGTDRINRDLFQYYDPKYLEAYNGKVTFKGNKLNVFCAMDVAWTETARSDYTAIVVIGVDKDGFIYVLDLDRFKTSEFYQYYQRVQSLQERWGFRKMLVETNAAGYFVAEEIQKFVRRDGGNLVVDRRSQVSKSGSKEDRWATILEPRYQSKSVFHSRGGLTSVLEEELVTARPRNDDLKDALCSAISISIPPSSKKLMQYEDSNGVSIGRFGGRVRVR